MANHPLTESELDRLFSRLWTKILILHITWAGVIIAAILAALRFWG